MTFEVDMDICEDVDTMISVYGSVQMHIELV